MKNLYNTDIVTTPLSVTHLRKKYEHLSFIPIANNLDFDVKGFFPITNLHEFFSFCYQTNKELSMKNKLLTHKTHFSMYNPFNPHEKKEIMYLDYIFPLYFEGDLIAYQYNSKYINPFDGVLDVYDFLKYDNTTIKDYLLENLSKPSDYQQPLTEDVTIDNFLHPYIYQQLLAKKPFIKNAQNISRRYDFDYEDAVLVVKKKN